MKDEMKDELKDEMTDVATLLARPASSSSTTPRLEHTEKDPSDVDELLRDLELFSGAGAMEKLVSPHVIMTATSVPRVLIRRIMTTPTADTHALGTRQQWLQTRASELVRVPPSEVAHAEQDVLWAWRLLTTPDEDVLSLHQSAYFSNWLLGNWLNRSPTALAGANLYRVYAAPIIGVLTPLMYIVVPYVILRFRFKVRIGFSDFLKLMYNVLSAQTRSLRGVRQHVTHYASIAVSLVFYFQGVFSSVQVSRMLHGVCAGVADRVAAIRRFSRHTLSKWEALGGEAAWRVAASCWTGPQLAWCEPSVSEAEMALARTNVAEAAECGAGGVCARYGADLAFFHTHVGREALSGVLRRAYAMDALGALVRMRDALGLQPVRFSREHAPLLELRGVWHPAVHGAVPNDWAFTPSERSALLTGPNAGGKSTLMKSVLMAVLMAQTLSFAPCREGMTLRPFGALCSHINVPDSHERGESLFQAEMNRAKRCVATLEAARASGSTALVVIDEIFSSTNPIEGIAGALATASRLGAFQNAVNIVSTHYTHMVKLTRGPEALFRAFKMPVILPPQQEASAPMLQPMRATYKLKRGVSTQYVALEIMKASGMDSEIVRDAIRVKEELLMLAGSLRENEKIKK